MDRIPSDVRMTLCSLRANPSNMILLYRRLKPHMTPQMQFWIRQQGQFIAKWGYGPSARARLQQAIDNLIARHPGHPNLTARYPHAPSNSNPGVLRWNIITNNPQNNPNLVAIDIALKALAMAEAIEQMQLTLAQIQALVRSLQTQGGSANAEAIEALLKEFYRINAGFGKILGLPQGADAVFAVLSTISGIVL